MKAPFRSYGLAGLLLATCGLASAQTPPANTASAPVATLSVHEVLGQRAEADLSVPASPAFAVLGLTPTSIQRPGSVRELVSAATKGFDKDGKVKSGLAIDFAPLPLFAQERVVGGDRYKNDPVTQVLTRTTVSLATADADGATQLAWGVRVGLFDLGDPGLFATEMAGCVRRVDVFNGAPPASTKVNSQPEEQEKQTKKAIEACAPGGAFELWAKPALYVGFGQSWYSGSGSIKDESPAVKVLWATYSVGRSVTGYRALLQLHGERKTDERVPDTVDVNKLLRQDTQGLVARLRVGAEKWHTYADLGRNRVSLEGAASANTRYRGLGLELRLKDDLWLQVGRSSESGFADGTTSNRVIAGIRFGEKPLFENSGNGK